MPVPRIIVPAIAVALAAVSPCFAETAMHHAHGLFDVATKPIEQDKGEGSTLGRFSLDKVYHGALEATGKGEMLTVGTEVPGSAVYVATERVVGTLDGRKGAFALVHRGAMRGKDISLVIDIVPDSGSGELKGLTGRLVITVADGKHQYDLEYALPQ
ncbi:DUF3224 domain-containing protein [uncultured Caulobacter sp.]|uniref:DUF3224 domain-containing protein n=1 Tax=uncultured Caulobacter sp. TaxID=158749 RepID=UPI0026053BCB|nr:DUF3224 domain-containing protein [uncultured Caulobacter sp.]